MWKGSLQGLCDLIFPPNCLLCKNFIPISPHDFPVCPRCQNLIKSNRPPFCQRCSRPLSRLSAGLFCTICQKKNPAFDAAWAACLFNESLRELIHYFKYEQRTALTSYFSHHILNFMTAYCTERIAAIDYLIPIPLHPARFRERGYNQALLLAQTIAQTLHIPLSKNNLIRVRYTDPQTELGLKDRWTNIQDAFRIKRPAELKGKNILLIDDLLTTGATVSEAAQVLKQAGAQGVYAVTLAIAQ